MLNIAGWFDHNIEECIENYEGLRAMSSVGNQHKLLIGPWVHGGVGPASTGTENQGDLNFPEAAGYHDIIGRKFIDYHVLGDQNGWDSSAGIQYFLMGENTWKTSEVWPPSMLKTQTFYLNADNSLSTSLHANDGSVSYAYNPEQPTPTIGGKTLHPDLQQGPFDISDIIENRNDVILFSTEELTSDLTILGKIKTNLFFSSDRKDTDLIIKITDVHPDGKSIMLDESFLRLRFRNGLTANDESLMIPGEVYNVELEFDNLAHTFLKGHKIRLVVTSSSYIRLNRNMNNGGVLYPNNNLDTIYNPMIATNSVYTGSNYPSRIDFPIPDSFISGTQNAEDKDQTICYPNPASNQIHVTGKAGEAVIISDQNGRILQKVTLGKNPVEINTQSWPSGIYWCNRKKLIISR